MSSDNPWSTEPTSSPSSSPKRPIMLSLNSSIVPSSAIRKKRDSFDSTISSFSSGSGGTSASTAGGSGSGDQLRPLRLTQQRTRSNSGSSSNSNPLSPLYSKASAKPSVSPDDFQCRPMRLGSRAMSQKTVDTFAAGATSKVQQDINDVANKRKSIQIKSLPIESSTAIHQFTDTSTENSKFDDMIFAVCLVDFHHQRGPEVQWWKSNYHPNYKPNLFKNIPFQALPDGSHLFEETFSNFNLSYDFKQGESIDDLNDLNQFKGDPRYIKTLFGCSCVRQVKTSDLKQEERERNKDITRSIVQKAIVIIVRKQPIFTKIKEKLSIITKTYFQQDTFENFELLENLFENLNNQFKLLDNELHEVDTIEHEEENFVNLNLKSSILNLRSNFMIIFKSLLLEKKIVIYSNNNLEKLTQFQNNLISLIPNLINNLDDSGCPLTDYTETNGPLMKPQSLVTTNRLSMLRFFGLPLQAFNTKNSFWNPYLPLQQLNELAIDSFMIGCSNLLFVNQAREFNVDVVINLDTNEVTYPKTNNYLPDEFYLSSLDKRFINHLKIKVKNDQGGTYEGNDDYIRYQFEDYINSLISTMRYAQYVERFGQPPPGFSEETDKHIGVLADFNKKFINCWKETQNFKIWNAMADEFIFNFVDPKHMATELTGEPVSLNKNISNFFNSFKFRASASSSPVNDGIKAQKYIPDDHSETSTVVYNGKNNSDENAEDNDDTIGDIAEGFETVQVKDQVTDKDENQTIGSKLYNWGWGQKQ
ncbi:Late secretory pathway protein AVL9 [Spathaspora sp. JA1]|nr:Late secretory pathway protein AVL9 [Spathaspora sp. JA1]